MVQQQPVNIGYHYFTNINLKKIDSKIIVLVGNVWDPSENICFIFIESHMT